MQTNNPLYELIRTVTSPAAGSSGAAQPGTVSPGAGSGWSDAIAQNTAQLSQLQNLFQSQATAIAENSQALAANTTTLSQSSAASVAGDIAKNVATSVAGGFMMNPIVAGLMKLFGGGSDQQAAAPALEKFALPDALNVGAGITAGVSGLLPLSYGQNGLPRVSAPSGQNVTVQVNAMDSQSFLDHSEDIANAVKRAMLESSSLNDVVSEL